MTESKNLLDEMLVRVDTLAIPINPDGTIYYINEALKKSQERRRQKMRSKALKN